MPAFGRENILKAPEISAVADYVRSLSGLSTEPGADLALGKKVFADNCAVCHGPDGKGNHEVGRPISPTRSGSMGRTRKPSSMASSTDAAG